MALDGRGDETRERLKVAARRLFAARGVEQVSVRDIVAAAGQKNGGSLHYYFRNKEALIREIVVDGARIIDDRRNRALDTMEAEGGPRTLREVLTLLVTPSLHAESDDEGEVYMRFITALSRTHRALFEAALESRWDSGFRRCIAHIRTLLPHLPRQVLTQRIVIMLLLAGSGLAAREYALERGDEEKPSVNDRVWGSSEAPERLVDALEGVLIHPAVA